MSEMSRLLIDLLCAEHDFESQLEEERIWDIKVEKRIRLIPTRLATQRTTSWTREVTMSVMR